MSKQTSKFTIATALLLLAGCAAPQPAADTVRLACRDAIPFIQAAALSIPAFELARLCAGAATSPEQVRRETEILIQALYAPI